MPQKPARRGRPAQLSRAAIVAAALRLLREDPARIPSMQQLARRLEVSPMSLYTHVRNRQDLMQAIAAQVLGQIQVPVHPGDWRATIRRWALELRAEMLKHPYLAQLLMEGVATPGAWLELSNPLLQALHDAGLRDQALADAQRWFSRVVVGGVLIEWLMPEAVPDELDGVARALQELPASQRALWQSMLPSLGLRGDQEVFEYSLERALDGLEVQLGAHDRQTMP